jgi:hypothetical protein
MKTLNPAGRGRKVITFPLPSITVKHSMTRSRSYEYTRGYLTIYSQAVTLLCVSEGMRVSIVNGDEEIGLYLSDDGFKVISNTVSATSMYIASPSIAAVTQGFYTFSRQSGMVFYFSRKTK